MEIKILNEGGDKLCYNVYSNYEYSNFTFMKYYII